MLGNFTYCNPTKPYFGADALDGLSAELPKYGENVVLIYGGSGMAYAQRYLQAHYPQLHWQTGSLVHGRDAAAFAKHALDDCG